MRKKEDLALVTVLALLEEEVMHSPVVILFHAATNRILPIWIGEPEARAIALAFQHVNLSRPLTHTLLRNVIHRLGARLERVMIDRFENNTYFAKLSVRKSEKRPALLIDSRPSDAIALALEVEVPIYVAPSILETFGQENPFPTELFSQEKVAKPQRTLTPEEVKNLSKLLEKARKREEQEGGGS